MDKLIIPPFTWLTHALAVLISILFTISLARAEQTTMLVDLPACQAEVGLDAPKVSIGIITDNANSHVVELAQQLAWHHRDVAVCAESWQSVLPDYMPWSKQLERGVGFALFLLAFLLVVGLLAKLTPRAWWRRTTLFGVLSIAGITWGLGVALLAAFKVFGGHALVYDTVVSLRNGQKAEPTWYSIADARQLESLLADNQLLSTEQIQQVETMPAKRKVDDQSASGLYKVYHRLNLREQAGVDSPRIKVLERGIEVNFNGKTQGDWWHIKTPDGTDGWANSIWLRRPEEFSTPFTVN